MINKIISFIVSIVMLVMTTIFPGFVWPGTETMDTGDFLAKVDQTFGFVATDTTETYLGVEPGDEYYEAVAAAAQYDVLVDYIKINVFDAVTPEFAATVLVNASGVEGAAEIANPESFTNVDKVKAAVANGIILPDVKGKVSTAPMSTTEIVAAITVAASLRFAGEIKDEVELCEGVKTVDAYTVSGDSIIVSADNDLKVGDVYVLEQSDEILTGAAYEVAGVEVVGDEKVITNKEVAIDEVVEKIDYAAQSTVDFATAMIEDGNGEVINDGCLDTAALTKADIMKTLKKLANVSFSVKGFKIKAKITDTGLDFSVAKSVCNGVTLAKSYSLSNLTVDAKADMNIAKLNFNEVYLKFDYDLVDTTSITGSYAKVFGDEVVSEGQKIDSDNFFAKAVNKYILNSFDSTSIKLFSFTLPIGSTPLTVTFDVTANIGVNGKMEIVVTSREFHGVEIINNKVSTVNDTEVLDRKVDIYGTFEACLGLDVALGLYGYALVDVGVLGGLGAYVEATAKLVDAEGNIVVDSKYTVPVDYLVELCSGADFDGKIDIGGHADIYGILKVSVGTNSVVDKVGLSKTWTIFDRGNGTFASIDF
ncbi:MAG: hypothetical protein KBT46_00680 [Ruminococcus sp.]|nr:hypothetical protein [Candidatus Copronaster equi]